MLCLQKEILFFDLSYPLVDFIIHILLKFSQLDALQLHYFHLLTDFSQSHQSFFQFTIQSINLKLQQSGLFFLL